MSTCISRHGEYSSHELGNGTVEERFVCARCSVLMEDALMEEVERLSTENAELRKRPTRVYTDPSGPFYGDLVVTLAKVTAAAKDVCACSDPQGDPDTPFCAALDELQHLVWDRR